MSRLASVAVALLFSLFSLQAQADPPGVSTRLRGAPIRALEAAPEQQTCTTPSLAPVGWVDPSDALAIATHPTARLDAEELHSITLASLVQLRFGFGGVTLFVIGAPARAGQQLTLGPQAGWRPRWPFC